MKFITSSLVLLAGSLGSITATSSSTSSTMPASKEFNEKLFLDARREVYTTDFCLSIKAAPFLAVINSASLTPEQKEPAFTALFTGCREVFRRAELTVHYATYLLLTGNETFLPLLLEGKEPLPLSGADLHNLVAVAYSQADERYGKDRLFACKAPHRSLSVLLSHCTLDGADAKEQLEAVRNYIDNHWPSKFDTYRDFEEVELGTLLLEHYLKHPEDLGRWKEFKEKKVADPVVKIEKEFKRRGQSNWASYAVVAGLIGILAAAIAITPKLAKNRLENPTNHPLVSKIE